MFRSRKPRKSRRTYSKTYRLDPTLRDRVMRRDRWTCVYCDAKAEHADHVHPRFYGGRDTMENIVASCARCNYAKSARILPGKSVAAKVAFFRAERLRSHQTSYRNRTGANRVPWWVWVGGILFLLAVV